VKRLDLVRHISEHGCIEYRQGEKHTVFLNPENGHVSTVPRHREIDIFLARKICRQLDIAPPPARA